jgi:hypothetical protein
MADEGTFCTTAEGARKAGEGANATAKAELAMNHYVQEAEGYLMLVARNDYRSGYASLNAETKELLREATSNLAGIQAIAYDMSGYTSRTEAELMMNVLKTRADEIVELLKDQKTTTYSTT